MPNNKSPMKHVWMVEDAAPQGATSGARSFWTKIGVAYDNADGSMTLQLAAVPVNGKMIIRPATPLLSQMSAGAPERAR